MAVNTAAASAEINSRDDACTVPESALNASTVIATGGTVFSIKDNNGELGVGGGEWGTLCGVSAFAASVFFLLRKNKKGKRRQKKMVAAMAMVRIRASFMLVFMVARLLHPAIAPPVF